MSANYERLRDSVLGYDDGYESSRDERDLYWCLWNSNWWPGRVLDLVQKKVIARDPRHEGERIAAHLTAHAIEKAAKSSAARITLRRKGGRPAN